MTTHSQPRKQTNDVYEWIRNYQTIQDEKALHNLVEHFRYLVESLARKYSKGRTIHEDLVQVGMIGLLAAIKRYDVSLGKSFESFAIPTITGEIKRFIRDKTWSIHVPRRIKELGSKLSKAVDVLTNELHRSPRVDELALYLQVDEEEILETMEISKSYHALSFDTKIVVDSDGNTTTLLEQIGINDSGFREVDQSLLINKIFSVLNDREKRILNYIYFEGLSQNDVGERLGISQMHVSRLQRRALNKLREVIRLEQQGYISKNE